MCSSDICLGLLAILFPPIAGMSLPSQGYYFCQLTSLPSPVWIKVGICSADSIINLLLCMLGYLPGLIHAWYVISLYPEPSYEDEYAYSVIPDAEAGHGRPPHPGPDGRVTYYYVERRGDNSSNLQQGRAPQQPHQPGYGTVNTSATAPAPAPEAAAAGEGSAEGRGVPPSYEQAIQGDNKVQR